MKNVKLYKNISQLEIVTLLNIFLSTSKRSTNPYAHLCWWLYITCLNCMRRNSKQISYFVEIEISLRFQLWKHEDISHECKQTTRIYVLLHRSIFYCALYKWCAWYPFINCKWGVVVHYPHIFFCDKMPLYWSQ